MSYSLLAHLYPHIRGSQEDIATLSLQYLLSQSEELNRSYTHLIADLLGIETETTLQYICQVTGDSEEKERPDMAGLSSSGKEEILCEMKFYATLTANQPITYLERLKGNRGMGLVFVCPTARKTSLWAKLLELCKEQETCLLSDSCASINGIRMAIIAWTEIIEVLKKTASSVAITYSSDIAQLEGYCTQLDNDAFIPFSASDLSAEMAKKGERYYDVIDEVIELIHADNSFSTSKKGLKATGYRKGYTRSIYIDDLTITLNYDRDLWKDPKSVETPFWVAIRSSDWKQTDDIVEKMKSFPEHHKQYFWSCIFLSLEPLQNATFAEVCEDLKSKIIAYYNFLK